MIEHFCVFWIFSLNTSATVWMIPYGLSNAVSTRVSNELGAGHPKTARLAVCVVLVTAVSEGIVVGLILILIRNQWGNAYSNDKEVVKYVATMMPLLATSNLLDGLQCVLSGTYYIYKPAIFCSLDNLAIWVVPKILTQILT